MTDRVARWLPSEQKLTGERWRDVVTLNHGNIACAVTADDKLDYVDAWWFYDGKWERPSYAEEREVIFAAWGAAMCLRAEAERRLRVAGDKRRVAASRFLSACCFRLSDIEKDREADRAAEQEVADATAALRALGGDP